MAIRFKKGPRLASLFALVAMTALVASMILVFRNVRERPLPEITITLTDVHVVGPAADDGHPALVYVEGNCRVDNRGGHIAWKEVSNLGIAVSSDQSFAKFKVGHHVEKLAALSDNHVTEVTPGSNVDIRFSASYPLTMGRLYTVDLIDGNGHILASAALSIRRRDGV